MGRSLGPLAAQVCHHVWKKIGGGSVLRVSCQQMLKAPQGALECPCLMIQTAQSSVGADTSITVTECLFELTDGL
jgi:hypothetical protein